MAFTRKNSKSNGRSPKRFGGRGGSQERFPGQRGDTAPRESSDRPSYGQKRSFGGERSERRPSSRFGSRDDRSPRSEGYGERPARRPFQKRFTPKVGASFDDSYRKPETKSYDRDSRGSDERRSFGSRDTSERSSYGQQRSYGGGRSDRNDGRRSFGGNSRGHQRGYGQRADKGRFGGRRNRGNAEHIDENKFIQKVVKKTPEEKYVAKHTFEDFGFDRLLEANIKRKGYAAPTPIQDQTIAPIMKGDDVLGLANTGSGKTGAFLLPLIHKIMSSKTSKAIIITPTRELALQIQQELFSLTRGMRVFSVACIGGDSINKQIGDLRRGYNFIVGTPGRLNDLLERGVIDLDVFDSVVLDEVDRMLDMGFADEIKELIAQLPEDKQSLFFSATMDRRVEGIIHLLLKPGYAKVVIKQKSHAENVQQDVVYFSDYDERYEKIKKMIDSDGFDKTLIFINTKREVEKIDKMLYKEGYQVVSIHGDKSQYQRKKAIDAFKSGKADVLIATDVAARGLDISGITHVINYDVPNNHEDYIHRIGRTGRAENYGTAYTFVRKNRH